MSNLMILVKMHVIIVLDYFMNDECMLHTLEMGLGRNPGKVQKFAPLPDGVKLVFINDSPVSINEKSKYIQCHGWYVIA